jgi:hypothetical protein
LFSVWNWARIDATNVPELWVPDSKVAFPLSMVYIRYFHWSLDTAYGRMVEPTVFAASPAVFKQEGPELLTSFRDTFWHVPSLTHLVFLVFMTNRIF